MKKIYFSIGFCGERPPIYGSGSPAKVESYIRKHLPDLRHRVGYCIKQLEGNCESFGASCCTCSFSVAKYDIQRYACTKVEAVIL